jgi:hypothetical protein
LAFGRWIVLGGTLAGIALAGGESAVATQAYTVIWRACVVALLVMALGGVAQRFWNGDKLANADAGGVGVGFDAATEDAVEKIETVVTKVNDRVNDQMLAINDRLYDLEKIVFKDDKADREG